MKREVYENRILDAFHQALQWKNGEITGVDVMQLEQRIKGILSSLHCFTDAELKERDRAIAGKAFEAGREEREELDVSEQVAAACGIRIYKYPDKDEYLRTLNSEGK